ncbi:MAG: DNA polymerase III subunit beta [Polyangiaceae bacterium]
MDLQIAKKDLLRLCSRCQGVADKKATMPALSNILLSAAGNSLHASATDMFLLATDHVPAEVATAGSIAVPARELLARVAAMPDGPVHFATSSSGQATIKASTLPRRFTLRCIPASDFPELPKPDPNAPTLSLGYEQLLRLLNRTKFSISPDETRPHVNSALFEWARDTLRMVTTDGHRLSKAETKIEGGDVTSTMLIPLKAINELKRLADDARNEPSKEGSKDSIRISQTGPHLFFEVGTSRFGVKLVDAQFPPYQQVIPKSATRTVKAPRKALFDALSAVKLAASDRTNGVKLTCLPGTLRITSESPDAGNGFDEIPVESDGPELTIGFNANYFIDVLSAMTDEDVALSLSGELDPAVIRPATEDAGESYLAVIMPMKI